MEGVFSCVTDLLVVGDIDFLSSGSDVEVKKSHVTCDYDMKRCAK